jgi:hypothetical protein
MAKQSDLIEQYLTSRPYASIKASDMFDTLGMYFEHPVTGRRSYTGGPSLADLIRGVKEGNKRGIPRPPLEGLTILEDHVTGHGSGGHSWPKLVLMYKPPRPTEADRVLEAVHVAPEEDPGWNRVSPSLDDVLAELRQVNYNLEALLSLQREAWGGSTQVFDPGEVLPQDEPGKTPAA